MFAYIFLNPFKALIAFGVLFLDILYLLYVKVGKTSSSFFFFFLFFPFFFFFFTFPMSIYHWLGHDSGSQSWNHHVLRSSFTTLFRSSQETCLLPCGGPGWHTGYGAEGLVHTQVPFARGDITTPLTVIAFSQWWKSQWFWQQFLIWFWLGKWLSKGAVC